MSLRLVSLNINYRMLHNRAEVRKLCLRLKPDFLCLVETRPGDEKIFKGLLPHFKSHADKAFTWKGLMVASRFPITSSSFHPGPWGMPSLTIHTKVKGRDLAVTGVHTIATNPMSLPWSTLISFFHRRRHIRSVAEAARVHRKPHLVAGDFNTTRSMFELGPILNTHEDALRSVGAAGPTYRFGIPIRIDYIFSRGVVPVAGETIRTPFSDHDAVVLDFELPGNDGMIKQHGKSKRKSGRNAHPAARRTHRP
ncbi:MAG: endonuclease/exonuclease/phosphatase family protein [Spirochaetia bacterium]|nr:endonuclease/exonuclease/phosphatase family protein [Spirochaetia bacterium]